MKTKITLLILLAFIALPLNAQECVQSASNFGNNLNVPRYNVDGDIEVVFDSSSDEVTLNFASNYSTANGPDLRIYLVNSKGATDDQLRNTPVSNLENVAFGLIPASGEYSTTVSAPSNIEEFDTVFFYCLQFNQFWDFGSYTPFTASNCSILSTEDTRFNKNTSLFPNPAIDQVTIANANDREGEIALFDMSGKIVFQNKGQLNQKINLSTFEKGLYLLKIKSQGESLAKKLIIQ